MKRITKNRNVGITLMMLSSLWKWNTDYDATGTFEATEVIVSSRGCRKIATTGSRRGNKAESG